MFQQQFEELCITLNELFAANRYIEYIDLSSAAIDCAYNLKLYSEAQILLRQLCVSYFQIGKTQIGINVLDQYRKLTFKYGTEIDIIQYYSLASIYWGTFGHIEKAEEFMLNGLEIAKRIYHVESLGKIYTNLSHIQIELGAYKQAKKLAIKSLYYSNVYDTKHEKPYQGTIHSKTNLAIAQIGLEEYPEAQKLLQELLGNIQSPPYSKSQLEVFNAYALLCEKQGFVTEAIEMYQKSKYYALENNDLPLLVTIYSNLVILIEQQNDIELLCAVQREYINTLLEIKKVDYTRVLFEMEYNHKKKQYEKKSYLDPLTNIYNRRYFDEHAEKMLQDAAETNQLLAFMVIDLDHFKSINDSNGHLFGDDVLTLTASTILSFFKNYESIVVRFGGDEFIVLTKLLDGESEQMLADSLYKQLSSLSLTFKEEEVKLEYSIGVSTNEYGRISQVEQIFTNADNALYESKRNGRNQITLFNPAFPV